MRNAISAAVATALVLTFAPGQPQAEIEISAAKAELSCFENDVNTALATISAADPKLREVVEQLKKADSGHRHRIISTDGPTVSYDNKGRSGQDIHWNPAEINRRFADNVCADPVASLAHELHHAFQKEMGVLTQKRDTLVEGIRLSELEAMQFENSYRAARGKCMRSTHGVAAVPRAFMPSRTCADPLLESCVPAITCVRCCCQISTPATYPYSCLKTQRAGVAEGKVTTTRKPPSEGDASTASPARCAVTMRLMIDHPRPLPLSSLPGAR
jgi:hypothetical protein